jgi:hypothetical protein
MEMTVRTIARDRLFHSELTVAELPKASVQFLNPNAAGCPASAALKLLAISSSVGKATMTPIRSGRPTTSSRLLGDASQARLLSRLRERLGEGVAAARPPDAIDELR